MHSLVKLVLLATIWGCAQGQYSYDSYGCTESNINNCMQSFLFKYGQQDQAALITQNKRNAAEIKEMCRDFGTARRCLDNFLSSCDEPSRRLFTGLYDMYDYICGDGLPLLLSHQECFVEPEVVSDLKVCNHTATIKFQDIQQKMYHYRLSAYFGGNSDEIEALKGQLCTTTRDLLACMSNSMTEHCDAGAAEFVVTLMKNILEPTMQQIDCDYLPLEKKGRDPIPTISLYGGDSVERGGQSEDSDSSSSSSSSEEENTNDHWWMKGAKDEEKLPVPSNTHGYSCSESNVHKCVQPFVDKYGLQDQTALFARRATRDENAMQQVCRDFSSVKSCINGFLSKCDDTSKKIFEGLYDMYDYTCGDGLYLYLAHQRCFARPDLELELKACNTTAASSYKQIQDHMTSGSYHSKSDVDKMKKKLCKTTHKLVSCMKDAVEDRCGDEAAEFATQAVNKMLAPTMREMECQKQISFTTWLAIAAGIVLLLVCIVGFTARLCMRKRRQQQRRAFHHAAIINQQQSLDDQPVYRGTTYPKAKAFEPPEYLADYEIRDTEPMLEKNNQPAPMGTPPPAYASVCS